MCVQFGRNQSARHEKCFLAASRIKQSTAIPDTKESTNEQKQAIPLQQTVVYVIRTDENFKDL